MDMQTLRANAREGMKGFCNLCPRCDGKWCAGKMPGMGGAITGAAFQANYSSLEKTKINLRVVHEAKQPDTTYDFFGTSLKTPIMNGPIGNANANCGPIDDVEFNNELIKGVHDAGSLGWIGDPCEKVAFTNGCEAVRKQAGQGVAIIKPHIDLENVRWRFLQAKEAGATAFGVDIDGAGILLLRKLGFPVGPKTVDEIKQMRSFVPDSPFIIKGIMTVEDAELCLEAGVDCIVVSNHGGRVLDGTPGVAEVLPAISKAVGGKMQIIADGAVRSGVDVLKMLALGASSVLIGRPACWGVYGGGAQGVKLIIDSYTDQLKQAMILTGCNNLSEINESVLYKGCC